MFDAPRWIEATGAVAFARIPDVTSHADAIAKHFAGSYQAPALLGMPDDIAPELPRLILVSNHGNSQLSISQVSVALQVRFTPDWQVAPEKTCGYVSERLELARGLLRVLPSPTPRFIGVSFLIVLPSSRTDTEIVHAIHTRVLGKEPPSDLYDVELKLARVVDDRYFENVTVRNYRHYRVETTAEVVRLSTRQVTERGVQIVIDFNDRHAFNEREGYLSDDHAAECVLRGALDSSRRAVTLFQSSP